MTRKIEISHRTVIFIFFFGLSVWFLYYIRDLILQLFVALLIMTILNPLVSRLSRYKIPRGVSVLVVYLLVFGIFGFTLASVANPLVEQTTSFVNNLPGYVNNLGLSRFIDSQFQQQIISQLGSVPERVIRIGVSLFSNILNVLAVLIIAFYLLLVREKLDEQLTSLFGEERRKKISAFFDELERRLGGWMRGQLALMLLVGAATYVGLLVLRIPYALPLALLAGLFEIVPYLGPVVAAVPTVIIAFSISPLTGVASIALYFLIQQFENYLFVPKVMEKSVGFSPIVTLLALAVGLRLAGIVGVLIAVPVVITLHLLLKKYLAGLSTT